MKFIGCRDDRRPGLLCMNSFGSSIYHKAPAALPPACFWLDASVCTSMLSSAQDSFAPGQFEGYPASRRFERISERVHSLIAG